MRVHILPATYGDALGQRRDLQSKPVVSAVSSADDLCSAYTALTRLSAGDAFGASVMARWLVDLVGKRVTRLGTVHANTEPDAIAEVTNKFEPVTRFYRVVVTKAETKSE